MYGICYLYLHIYKCYLPSKNIPCSCCTAGSVHIRGEVAPRIKVVVPLGHPLQPEAPVMSLYCPYWQEMQTSLL